MSDNLITIYESGPNVKATWDNGKLLTTEDHPLALPEDAIQEYGDGAVAVLNGGVAWDADGAVQSPSQNRIASDNFECLSDGVKSGQVLNCTSQDGPGWDADGYVQ
jgi:hypothetical protein